MELQVVKGLDSPEKVRGHELFGHAVFVECGLHEPQSLCFDHHSMVAATEWSLSSAGMVHQQMLQRRRLPQVVVMNHVRHLDNLMALYVLMYRGLVFHPDTFTLVSIADLIDRVGPLAVRSVPQVPASVLMTAQAQIPFKEWELGEGELRDTALKAVQSIRAMAAMPQQWVDYETVWTSPDGKFIIVTCEKFIGSTLYDQGYDGYAVYAQNADGSYKWTLARASEYVPFDIPATVQALNKLEPGWGGRATIAGSPRDGGSNLDPQEVIRVLADHYQNEIG